MADARFAAQLDDMKGKIPTRLVDAVVIVDAVYLNRYSRLVEFLDLTEDSFFEGRITFEAETLVDEPLHRSRS